MSATNTSHIIKNHVINKLHIFHRIMQDTWRGRMGGEEFLQESHYEMVSTVHVKLPFLQLLPTKFLSNT